MGSGFLNRAIHDVLFIMLAFFIFAVVMMMPHLNPKGDDNESDITVQGMLVFETRWGDGLDIDIDSWVRAPGQNPTGFSNQGTRSCNLLRDDLGATNDPSDNNFEMIMCRGLIANEEYRFNLHYYDGDIPNVAVRTRVSYHLDNYNREIDKRTVILMSEKHETTVVAITLNEEGYEILKHDTFVSVLPVEERDGSF